MSGDPVPGSRGQSRSPQPGRNVCRSLQERWIEVRIRAVRGRAARFPAGEEHSARDGRRALLPISDLRVRDGGPHRTRQDRELHLEFWKRRRGGMADAPALGAGARKGVEVQILSPTLKDPAPKTADGPDYPRGLADAL